MLIIGTMAQLLMRNKVGIKDCACNKPGDRKPAEIGQNSPALDR